MGAINMKGLVYMTQEDFEKRVLDKLLNGREEPFKILKKQYLNSNITSRDFTGRGFFTSFSIPDELVVSGMKGTIDDVSARFDDSDLIYMFILFVRDGKIDCLEGVTVFGDWEYNYDNAILQYEFDDERHHSIKGYL